MRLRRAIAIFLPALAAASIALVFACSGDDTIVSVIDASADQTSGNGQAVKVQILAINDFHGNLEPPTGTGGVVLADGNDPEIGDAGVLVDASGRDAATKQVPAGGAAYLAAHIAQLKSANPSNTAIVSAGDLTGASPLVSSLFHDEPAVLVMNAIGLDFNGVGNHEFDHGVPELRRLQYGGCHPDDCADGGSDYPGASFEYLAANVDVAKNKTVFPPYGIKQLGGEKIAFIGMTLKDTPSVTIPSSVAGLTFDDEVATVNALLPEIRKEGVSAIVVLLHQGDIPTAGTLYDGCGVAGGVGSFIVDIATKLDPAVDVVLSAHSHQAYNCTIAGKLVTSASSFGRVVTQVDLTIDSAQHRVTDKTAKNHAVTQDIAPDPAVQSIVASYTERAKDRANRVVGHLTGPLPRQVNASGPPEEWVLGDTIADAMLAATKKPGYDAVVAFMNPGGIRADVTCDGCSVAKPGAVTYTQAFTTQPFGNYLVTMTLTGANIRDILQQQFTSSPPKILQVSKGFTYTYTGTTVDFASIKINGVPISANATYRVTTNNFVATGGDGFTVFTKGTASKDGDIDIDAFTKYLTANDPLTPPPVNRITRR